MKKAAKSTAIVIFAIICIGILIAISSEKPITVDVVKVTKGKAVEAVYATAVVEPELWAAIAPVKTGRIAEVNNKEGDVVSKGDVLAKLDNSELLAQLTEEQELANFYQDSLTRSADLLKKGFESQEKYDAKKTDLARAKARVSKITEQIKQLSLVAPMNGTVLWRDVELGEVKEVGQPIFWVGQPQPLRLEAEIDEEDIPKIKIGQTVLITADAFPGEYMEGAIDWISPKGDPINKSYRVYVTLSEDTKLMIGMTVETNTVVEEKESALLVPIDALVEDSFLWVVKKSGERHQSIKVKIEIGLEDDDQVEVLQGVNEETLIIMPPYDKLSQNSDIRLK